MRIFKFFCFLIFSLAFTVPVAAQGDILPLMYHDFSETEEGAELNPDWCTSQDKFRQDIQELYDMGYESLSLEDYAHGNFDKEKLYFILTFDDGYASCCEVALPVLIEMKAKAAVFINTDKISEEYDRMTWEQVQKMEDSGLVEAYSHMPDHVDATGIGIDEFEKMVAGSCAEIEEILGDRINRRTAFAYPYGLYNSETHQRLADMGFSFQLVQGIEKEDLNKNGFVIRSNVAYQTDIKKLAREHRFLNRPM